MPIDTSIYSRIQQPQIEGPMDAAAKAMSLKSLMNQGQIQNMQMQQAQRGMEKEGRLAEIAKTSGGDPVKMIDYLRNDGLWQEANQVEKSMLEQRKGQREEDKARIEGTLQRMNITEQVLSTAKDQSSYDEGVGLLVNQYGFDKTKIPTNYDPARIAEARQQSMPLKERLEQEWKQKGYDLEVSKFDETKNQNQFENKLNVDKFGHTVQNDAQQRALTARGQNITKQGQIDANARSTEANTIAREKNSADALGKPPAGYRWDANGNQEAIPGGPATKVTETQQKQITGVQNLQNAITEYKAELKNFGIFSTLSPSNQAAMGTKYNNMLLQAKEAYNLGVLNGQDYEILQRVVTDPRSITGIVTPKKALEAQATELGRIMGVIEQTAKQGHATPTKNAGAQPQQPSGGFKYLGKE